MARFVNAGGIWVNLEHIVAAFEQSSADRRACQVWFANGKDFTFQGDAAAVILDALARPAGIGADQ